MSMMTGQLGAALWCSVLAASGCGAPTVVVLEAPREQVEPGPRGAEGVSSVAQPEQPMLVAGDDPAPRPVARTDDCQVPLPEPRCRRVPVAHVRASSNQADASRGLDGSACTVWSASGRAPQFLEVDLGEPAFVDGFELVPEMTPNGVATHVIEVSLDGERWEPAHRIEGAMQSGVAFEMLLPKTMRARFLKVSTLASPSRIAWRDIVVLHCSGGP